MAAFQSVVDDYVKNVKRVIQNPHSQIVNFRTSRKAEQIKFWTPAMEERYSEVKKKGNWKNITLAIMKHILHTTRWKTVS